ncbi:hypothetical protein [Spongiactinospora sp. TRM90649]|uniref:hypothetical protein n=1 Tax=Spongiactinospora sp. TRM90649 TaxID=3031114 RepID=UPI0023F65502|nr:hypothetical protein [Spongiactinospora sp. TRM90649]MDF5752954.1 hypothetical protein [Spongiactinospora sp. TRM90649]
MRKSFKIALPAILTAGLLAFPGAFASSASASSSAATGAAGGSASAMALSVSGYCEPLARRFLCSVSVSGAVAPVAVRWYVNGYYIPSYDNRTFVGIGCQPTFSYDIRATVSDATGASADYHTVPTCRSGNP